MHHHHAIKEVSSHSSKPIAQSSVIIGIGSNIDPEANLKKAAALLRNQWPGIRFSPVYRSPAAERSDQPDFLNAVAMIETDETPERIIAALQSIEQALGKAVPLRFGPRTIDLDLLLYGDEIMPDKESWLIAKQKNDPQDMTLYVPHLRMDERRFVLEPLLELMPEESHHPALDIAFMQLLAQTRKQACEKTTEDL